MEMVKCDICGKVCKRENVFNWHELSISPFHFYTLKDTFTEELHICDEHYEELENIISKLKGDKNED